MSISQKSILQNYIEPKSYLSNYNVNSWLIPKTTIVLLVTLFWIIPIVHRITGAHLIILSIIALTLYLVAIAFFNCPIEGLIGGIFGLATSSASIPLIYAETSRANLTLNIADPFVGLFLVICGYWIYQADLQRPRGFIALGVSVLWVSWTILAAVFGAGPSQITALFFAIGQARWVIYLLTGLCLVSVIPLRVGVVTVAIAGVIHTPVAIAQSIILGPLGFSVLGSSTRQVPITMTIFGRTVETGSPVGGFAGNATALATITLLSIAVSLFYLMRGEQWQRGVSALSLPGIILSLILAGSDTALVACVTVVLGMVIVLSWHRLPDSIRRTAARFRSWVAGASVIGAAIITLVIWRIGTESLFTYIPIVDGGNFDTRVEKYQAALDIAREYPVFGLGGANFELVSAEYVDGPVNAIHSTPFEFLAGTGVIGLSLYIGLLAVISWYAIRAIDNPRADHSIILILYVWAVGFAMLSMLNLIWPAHSSNSVFWLLAGMVTASGDYRSLIHTNVRSLNHLKKRYRHP